MMSQNISGLSDKKLPNVKDNIVMSAGNMFGLIVLRSFFIAIHLGCLGVFFTGFSEAALWFAFLLYWMRGFFITGFYHRYFAHRAYKTGRVRQFIFAVCGAMAMQGGPLWWLSNHRRHHLYADTEDDVHSPLAGIWWSHVGWLFSRRNWPVEESLIRDYAAYPELSWLNRLYILVPTSYFIGLYILGESLSADYQTGGWQMVVWAGCISTVTVYHTTFCVNSICHLIGKRAYKTDDFSRNNWVVAILALGEGWHNNHHRYPGSARQGFFWWQFDMTYLLLRLMDKVGLISDLRPVPQEILDESQ